MWGALLAGRGETIMAADFRKTDVGAEIESANITNWKFLEDN